MPESPRLMGRNGAIWREYCRGATQEALAEKYALSQQHVGEIINKVADSIPQQERTRLINEEVDFFRAMRVEALAVWDMPAAPVTAGKDGDIVRDPTTQEVVRDHSGRIAAARLALDMSARMHKLLGLEAATKLDVGVGEEEAAKRAASEALAHLHGGGAPDDAR